MNDYTMYLFARPSFLEGMGRAIDLGGFLNEYNNSLSPSQADRLALKSDVAALKRDVALARERISGELSNGAK